MKKNTTVWLVGMTCLKCGKGLTRYSLDKDQKAMTMPCDKCGDVRFAVMKRKEYLQAIQERDNLALKGDKS